MMASQKPGTGGEYYLPEAIDQLRAQGRTIYACEIKDGKYYDTGNKMAYMKTVVDFALRHPEINGEFRAYLKKLVGE